MATDGTPIPAVAYVRMSTDHQKYSTDNQLDVIRQYADSRGLQIIHVYEDAGRSGLRIDGREALQKLMEDVRSGTAGFAAILVYDVSRWGRFQDADEGAYYEHLCSRAGIPVHYCGEQFENDGSIGSNLLKTVKRVMAGEYSRELSVKVFAGHCRQVEHGYRQGGNPGYGLRRRLIDEHGVQKAELSHGERKSLQTDRVVLVLGPDEEVRSVQRIYRMFLDNGLSEAEISSVLNQEGTVGEFGRRWSRATVHQILTNEKYIGNNVYNRVSFKLKQRRVVNGRDMWIRAENAFPAIVERALFERARSIIEARSRHLSDEELLGMLQQALGLQGALSGFIIDSDDKMPSSSVYRYRFGSLLHAYELVGYNPDRDYRYVEVNRTLRRMHPNVIAEVVLGLRDVHASVSINPVTDLLTVNDEITVSVVVVRCSITRAGSSRWRIRLDTGLVPDITIAVRMDEENSSPLDYYLLPGIDMTLPRLLLAEQNGLSLDSYRFEGLSYFYELAARIRIMEAA